jgi:hypothetical protein
MVHKSKVEERKKLTSGDADQALFVSGTTAKVEFTPSTLQEQKAKILTDIEALALSNVEEFLQLAAQVAEMAQKASARQLGQYHPLSHVLGRRKDDPAISLLMKNIGEVREEESQAEG